MSLMNGKTNKQCNSFKIIYLSTKWNKWSKYKSKWNNKINLKLSIVKYN